MVAYLFWPSNSYIVVLLSMLIINFIYIVIQQFITCFLKSIPSPILAMMNIMWVAALASHTQLYCFKQNEYICYIPMIALWSPTFSDSETLHTITVIILIIYFSYFLEVLIEL